MEALEELIYSKNQKEGISTDNEKEKEENPDDYQSKNIDSHQLEKFHIRFNSISKFISYLSK